jgi:hypothetical protein
MYKHSLVLHCLSFRWDKELAASDVLVMTPEVLLHTLAHGVLKVRGGLWILKMRVGNMGLFPQGRRCPGARLRVSGKYLIADLQFVSTTTCPEVVKYKLPG